MSFYELALRVEADLRGRVERGIEGWPRPGLLRWAVEAWPELEKLALTLWSPPRNDTVLVRTSLELGSLHHEARTAEYVAGWLWARLREDQLFREHPCHPAGGLEFAFRYMERRLALQWPVRLR